MVNVIVANSVTANDAEKLLATKMHMFTVNNHIPCCIHLKEERLYFLCNFFFYLQVQLCEC